jgi:hypothetical protein
VLLNDHVAEVDADAEPDAPFLWHLRLALAHAALDLHGAADRVDHAGKFRKHSVAGVLYDPAAVLGDLRIDQFLEMSLEPLVRALLIGAHQARVPGQLSGEDRCEAAGLAHPSQPALRRPSTMWAWSSGRCQGTRRRTYMSKEPGATAIAFSRAAFASAA